MNMLMPSLYTAPTFDAVWMPSCTGPGSHLGWWHVSSMLMSKPAAGAWCEQLLDMINHHRSLVMVANHDNQHYWQHWWSTTRSDTIHQPSLQMLTIFNQCSAVTIMSPFDCTTVSNCSSPCHDVSRVMTTTVQASDVDVHAAVKAIGTSLDIDIGYPWRPP